MKLSECNEQEATTLLSLGTFLAELAEPNIVTGKSFECYSGFLVYCYYPITLLQKYCTRTMKVLPKWYRFSKMKPGDSSKNTK